MDFETNVYKIIERTPHVKSFRFRRPEGFSYLPGQWMFVTLRIDGSEIVKHFTISSSPTEPDHLEFTKKITDHEFSRALNALQVGDSVNLNGPYGTFTFTGGHPRVVFITGGIGITPFRSIIRYCYDGKVPCQMTLLYGNRDERSIVFGEELDSLAGQNPDFTVVHCLSHPTGAWKGRTGHVDKRTVIEEVLDYPDRVFYVSGPPRLVTDLTRDLKELGIPDERIHTENFTGY